MIRWAELDEDDVVIHIHLQSPPELHLPGGPGTNDKTIFASDGLIRIDDEVPGKYASIGFVYNRELESFIPPAPGEDYVLNKETFEWELASTD